jgi:trimeric autotransporter adhesin
MAYQPKNRKFLAGTITAAVVASAVVAPAASAAEVKFTDLAGLDAETNTAIEALVGLGVIKGYPDGTFKPNQTINRGQAAEMTVKALKLDTPAPTGKVFEDLTDKSYYAKFAEALATAKLIPAGGKFGAATDMTREAMALALVTGLGLTDNGTAVEVKDIAGLSAESQAAIKILAQHKVTLLLDGNFNPKDAVKRSQFALFFHRGVVAAEAAKAETKATVKVVDTNKVEVTFNKAVDTTKATVALKKGLATQYTTAKWAEDKKSVVLEAPSAIPAGDYEVVVTGLEKEIKQAVKVEAAVSKAIEVSNVSFEKSGTALVSFKVSNQYNTDMKVPGASVTVTAYNVTQNTVVPVGAKDAAKSEFNLDLSNANFKVDDEIRVIVTYNGLTTTKVGKLAAVGTFADISLGNVELKANTTRITVGEAQLKLPYVLKDQYGKDLKLTQAAFTGANPAITFVSSDNNVVNPASFAVDANGNLTLTAGNTAGTATITAIINSTGKVAQTTVTVNATAALKTVAINAPTTLIAAGETVSLDLAGVDQFGGAVTNYAGVVVSSTNAAVTGTIVNGKLQVATTGTTAGTATLTLKNATGTVTYGTVTVNFEAKAVPTAIVGVDAVTNLEVGATTDVAWADLKVKDQYGRDYALTATDVVTATAVDATFDGVTKVDGAQKFTFNAAAAAGTEVVKFALANGAAFNVNFATVATASIASYTIDAIGTVHAPAVANAAYNVGLQLTGKLADGTNVVLASNKVTHATSSNQAVATVNNAGVVTGLTKGSSTVTLWAGANKLAEVVVNVDTATPVATTVSFNETTPLATTVGGTLDLATKLTVKDQYGVAINTTGFYATSDSATATVTAAGVVTGVKAGKVTITYVTSNGIVKTATVTIN